VTAGRHRARRRLRLVAVRVGLAVVAVGGGVVAVALPEAAPAASAPATTGRSTPTAEPLEPMSVTVGDAAGQAAAPTRVRVPSIDVESELVRLGVDADRVLVPPTDFGTAGWFAEGPAPGETGPAVIAGHVDSTDGPAVFFRLRELQAGDEVLVDRADGSTARFEVRSVQRYPKDAFPTEEVYGPTPRAELRLITCGGEFDSEERSYRDNVVVSAQLVT
jgi:sortase (surface protein transpeptidase)